MKNGCYCAVVVRIPISSSNFPDKISQTSPYSYGFLQIPLIYVTISKYLIQADISQLHFSTPAPHSRAELQAGNSHLLSGRSSTHPSAAPWQCSGSKQIHISLLSLLPFLKISFSCWKTRRIS